MGEEDGDEAQPQVEYEIVDENGNQILINDAEQLKQLATSVSEIRQPDGSIVKEYILNDPGIIEKIRNKIRSESIDNLAEASLKSSKHERHVKPQEAVEEKKPLNQTEVAQSQLKSSSQALPFMSQVQQNIKKFQNSPSKPKVQEESLQKVNESKKATTKPIEFENNVKQINRNKFELKTKKGKALQFIITSEDTTDSDIEECKSMFYQSLENAASLSKSVDKPKEEVKVAKTNNTSFQPFNNHTAHQTESSSRTGNNVSKIKPPAQRQQQQNLNYLNFTKNLSKKVSMEQEKPASSNVPAPPPPPPPFPTQPLHKSSIKTMSNDAQTKSTHDSEISLKNSSTNSLLKSDTLNSLDSSKLMPKLTKNVINKGTYTKSSMNLNTNTNQLKKGSPPPPLPKLNKSLLNTSLLNKSVDNLAVNADNTMLYDPSIIENLNITPEMTQQLLLKLLLQQISSNLSAAGNEDNKDVMPNSFQHLFTPYAKPADAKQAHNCGYERHDNKHYYQNEVEDAEYDYVDDEDDDHEDKEEARSNRFRRHHQKIYKPHCPPQSIGCNSTLKKDQPKANIFNHLTKTAK